MNKKSGSKIANLIKEINGIIDYNMRKKFNDTGLTLPQVITISILDKDGEMNINELSMKLSLSKSTTSGIVDRLEKQGTVERVRSSVDRRVVYVRLTEQAKNMHKSMHSKVEGYLDSTIKDASQEDLDLIIDGLNRLKSLLKNNCRK